MLLYSWLSSPRSTTAREDRVSYEGVDVGCSERAVLGGNPLGIVVIYTGQGLVLLAGMGYTLKLESVITKKGN